MMVRVYVMFKGGGYRSDENQKTVLGSACFMLKIPK